MAANENPYVMNNTKSDYPLTKEEYDMAWKAYNKRNTNEGFEWYVRLERSLASREDSDDDSTILFDLAMDFDMIGFGDSVEAAYSRLGLKSNQFIPEVFKFKHWGSQYIYTARRGNGNKGYLVSWRDQDSGPQSVIYMERDVHNYLRLGAWSIIKDN